MPSLKILLIADEATDVRPVRGALSRAFGAKFRLQSVTALEAASALIQAADTDVALLDLGRTGSRGIAALHRLQQQSPELPIIVLTDIAQERLAALTVREGAQDCLVKRELTAALLGRSIRYAAERKRAEQRIQWLSKAVDQSPAAVLITDLEGTIQYVNARFTQISGYAEAEVIGRKASILKSGETPPERYHELWATIGAGREWHGELLNRTKGGTLYWDEALISPLRDGTGRVTHYLSVQQDVTLRKRADLEIKSLNDTLEARVQTRTAQLEAANQELEAFTYSVSHDLRAPLRQIEGFTRILLRTPELERRGRHYLDRIHESTVHMRQLTDDLLDMARLGLQELRLLAVPLGDVVRAVIPSLTESVAGRRIDWSIAPLPVVRCDPGLMSVVFNNLLSNALKYTRPRERAVIEVGCYQEGTTVVFVRDNGVGFDMKYADRLFGVFQRLHPPNQFEGSGVGLATVHRIVRKHGGHIWADAAPGRGAAFYFTLTPLDCGRAAP